MAGPSGRCCQKRDPYPQSQAILPRSCSVRSSSAQDAGWRHTQRAEQPLSGVTVQVDVREYACGTDGSGRSHGAQFHLLHNADPTYILFSLRPTFCPRIEQEQRCRLGPRGRTGAEIALATTVIMRPPEPLSSTFSGAHRELLFGREGMGEVAPPCMSAMSPGAMARQPSQDPAASSPSSTLGLTTGQRQRIVLFNQGVEEDWWLRRRS